METTMKGSAPQAFDEDGFLLDPAQWDRQLAQRIASQEGVGDLGDAHWTVIRQLRDHYLKSGALSPTSHVCRVSQLDPQCVAGLFRNMLSAWRIAGLPNPGEEAKSYM